MSSFRDPRTKPGDAVQDLVGGFRPHEGLGRVAREVNVSRDRVAEGLGAPVGPAFDLLAREFEQPALDEIEPRCAGEGEVQMEPRMPQQSAMDGGCFVGGVVIEDQMDVEIRRHGRVDAEQKLPKLLGAMARVAGPDDGPRFHIQRREERRRPVPDVVVGASGREARAHPQERRRAIEGLNLTLLVDAGHQRPIRRMQVQPDDVPHFVDEERVLRQFERLGPMRLQREGFPDARLSTDSGLRAWPSRGYSSGSHRAASTPASSQWRVQSARR